MFSRLYYVGWILMLGSVLVAFAAPQGWWFPVWLVGVICSGVSLFRN